MDDIANIDKAQIPDPAPVSGRRTFLYVRNAIGYALLYITVSAVISYLLNVPVVAGNISLKLIIIPALSYLLLGILFTGFLSKLRLNGNLPYAVSTFVCIFLVVLLTGAVNKNGSVVTSLFYSFLFLIPYMIYQTWVYYKSLSAVGYNKIWHLPEHINQAPIATVFLNSLRIKIRVSPFYGATEKVYETTVPGRMSVGSIFTNFIYEENKLHADSIEFKDMASHQIGWQFFTSDFFGLVTRPVDPDLSLHANNVKNNSVIIARRAQKQLT